MPSVGSSRVKTTGTGAIYYTTDTAASTAPTDNVVATTGSSQFFITGDNIGYGHGVFAGRNGDYSNAVLSFKSINAGLGIEITETDSTLTITALGNGVVGGNGALIGDGLDLQLGSLSFANGAITLTPTLDVTHAIDGINELLGLLIPAQPPVFPNSTTLSIVNVSGNTPLLANSVPNNTGGGAPTAGSAISRVVGLAVNSNTFNDVGPANMGNVSLLVNNTVVTTIALNGSNQTSGGLVISDTKAYPTGTPGFWTSMDVAIVNRTTTAGVNRVKISQDNAGQTNHAYFVTDTMVSTPNITSTSLVQASNGTVAYSSSVPHYGLSGQLLVYASLSNLAGNTYYGGSDPVIVSGSNSIITSQNFTYTTLGISTPIAKDTISATAITPVLVNVDGSVHDSGYVQMIAKNVNGQSGLTSLTSTKVLVKRGSASTSRIDEMLVPVNGLGSLPNTNFAYRAAISGGGDTPTGSQTVWVSNASLPTYETAVVGGVLSHDQTDYSTGFLPVGPNLSSGRSGAQYATFAFARTSLSQFKINVTGTYSGCWVKLPSVSNDSGISPNSVSGWWNAFVAYNGAGVPGNSSDLTAGCIIGTVMSGTSGAFTVTFGPQSSTNSLGNLIIVRFKLVAGQKITALSFTN